MRIRIETSSSLEKTSFHMHEKIRALLRRKKNAKKPTTKGSY